MDYRDSTHKCMHEDDTLFSLLTYVQLLLVSPLQTVNIVAAVAEFLQTYTDEICAESYAQIKEVLQALIEMCVGNPPNQHVILEKQVVDPINRILQLDEHKVTEKPKKVIASTIKYFSFLVTVLLHSNA